MVKTGRVLPTGLPITKCDMCGKDTTGTGKDFCGNCEMNTTPQVRELARRYSRKAPKSYHGVGE